MMNAWRTSVRPRGSHSVILFLALDFLPTLSVPGVFSAYVVAICASACLAAPDFPRFGIWGSTGALSICSSTWTSEGIDLSRRVDLWGGGIGAA